MGYHANLAPVFVALLALGGQIGLPILVLTSFRSKRLNRPSTFANFCITLIIYSLVFCILIYPGEYRTLKPNRALCIAQASMAMAVLPTVCVAALMIVVQTWAMFQDPCSVIFVVSEKPLGKFTLLVAPYITFLGFLLASITVATSISDAVGNQNGLYCFFKMKAISTNLGPLSCLVLLTLTAVIEAIIVVQWYRRWHVLKKAFPLADKKAHLLICFRACLFNIYTWLSIAASVVIRKKPTPSISYLAVAGLPLAAFLVLGTTRDILEAWGIRKPATSGTSSETSQSQQVSDIGSTATEENVPSDS